MNLHMSRYHTSRLLLLTAQDGITIKNLGASVVAMDGHIYAGELSMDQMMENKFLLDMIEVKPEYRGRNIAKMMLQAFGEAHPAATIYAEVLTEDGEGMLDSLYNSGVIEWVDDDEEEDFGAYKFKILTADR